MTNFIATNIAYNQQELALLSLENLGKIKMFKHGLLNIK